MRWIRTAMVVLVTASAFALTLRRRRGSAETPPNSPNGYQVLTAANLAQRSIDVFPTAYTTVLSIAQGVALGVLVTSAAREFPTAQHSEVLPLTLQTATSAGSILVVYYMYVWFVLVFRWAPGVWDSIIPLALGGVEIALAVSIGSNALWVLWLAILMLTGGFAFAHSISRAKGAIFSEKRAHAKITGVLKLLCGLSFAGFALYAVAWSLLYATRPAFLANSTATFTLVVLVIMLAASERALNELYKIYGLERWPSR